MFLWLLSLSAALGRVGTSEAVPGKPVNLHVLYREQVPQISSTSFSLPLIFLGKLLDTTNLPSNFVLRLDLYSAAM